MRWRNRTKSLTTKDDKGCCCGSECLCVCVMVHRQRNIVIVIIIIASSLFRWTRPFPMTSMMYSLLSTLSARKCRSVKHYRGIYCGATRIEKINYFVAYSWHTFCKCTHIHPSTHPHTHAWNGCFSWIAFREMPPMPMNIVYILYGEGEDG